MSATRRTWIVGGVGALAAAAGIGWQAWRDRRAAEALATEHGGLWTMRFEQPQGGELVMATLRGRPLVINFWATWCPPCVKEMPEIDRFFRAHAPRGWQVVGLAIDGPAPVRDFLARVPVAFPIGLAGFGGSALARALGNETGALPFTVVFDARGRLVQRKLGETSEAELTGWAKAL